MKYALLQNYCKATGKQYYYPLIAITKDKGDTVRQQDHSTAPINRQMDLQTHMVHPVFGVLEWPWALIQHVRSKTYQTPHY